MPSSRGIFDRVDGGHGNRASTVHVYLSGGLMSAFDKLIPKGAPEKDGIKIAIVSDYNIAGQPTYMMRAINKYTPHRARAIIVQDDFMQFDRDVILRNGGSTDLSREAVEEAVEILSEADFFVFGRGVFSLGSWDANKHLTPKNCFVQLYGSELRYNGAMFSEYANRTGIPVVTSDDMTMNSKLKAFQFYHLGDYFTDYGDMRSNERISCRDRRERGKKIIITGGSGTSGIKGYDALAEVVSELAIGEGYPVEFRVIEKMNHAQALREKEKGHICFASLFGGWGISGVESMWLGQPVLAAVDPFLLSLYPDQPAIAVDRSNLKDEIRRLIDLPGYRSSFVTRSIRFANEHFQNSEIIKRYSYIIDYIRGRDQYEAGNYPRPRLYEF
jgi:hypothetical protein